MSGLAAPETCAAALAGLPGMNPRRLINLLDGFQPMMAWHAVLAGTHPADPDRRFSSAARRTDVQKVGECHARLGVQVLLPDQRGYPSALVGDPGAPAVLFALGDPLVLEGGPRVAIVGTRAATHYGRRVASELAGAIAAEGVTVVSGLASGIDAAAHAGALRAAKPDPAPPAAVVGTGLNVVYPSSNRELWRQVAGRGVVFSESALGTRPHPGVFPARNRIIAALSDVVVVVESHLRGGALYTAEAAARRSIPVCVVPGSVHSRASEGSNALLVEGCIPVRDAEDIMVALSLVRAGKKLGRIRARGGTASRLAATPSRGASSVRSGLPAGGCASDGPAAGVAGPLTGPAGGSMEDTAGGPTRGSEVVDAGGADPLTAPQQALMEAVDDTPTAFETILIRTDLSIAAAAEACDQLVERGILRSGAGWWSTA
jgi:DNA processing protein